MSSYIINGTCISGTCQTLDTMVGMPWWLPLIFTGIAGIILAIFLWFKRADGEDTNEN